MFLRRDTSMTFSIDLDRMRRDLDSTWTLAMGHETAYYLG